METQKLRAVAPVKKAGIEMREVNEIVRDLLVPQQAVYWTDLTVSSALGWTSFGFFLSATTVVAQICFLAVAVISLFRCLFFIHELSHHSSKDLPGFGVAWNLLIGIPLMIPSFLYDSVHLDHHRRHKYGTLEDPEYLPLGRGSQIDILVFLGKTVLFPVMIAVRFLLLAPIGLLVPPFHKWLEVNLSALVINESYKRKEMSELERSRVKVIEFVILVFWAGIAAAYTNGLLPSDFFLDMYLLIFGIGFVNQIRTLVAHRYSNENGEMEYEDQLLDSVNVEGGFLTELWAPVGSRYHALHHFVPKLPYHSLPEAHRRMLARFGENPIYKQVNEASFWSAFKKLWRASAYILAFCLLAAPHMASAAVGDPCVKRIESSVQRNENRGLINKGLTEVKSVTEVDRSSSTDKFGRFFEASFGSSKKALFWMIPYAQGKACVLRDVKVL